MKKSAKKLIALLLTAVMLLGCGLVSASAAEADYTLIYPAYGRFGPYILCSVNGYQNSLGDEGLLEIPAEISGVFDILLTQVADNAFAFYNPTDTNAAKYSKELKKLVVPDLESVLGEQVAGIGGAFVIGDHSFYNLAALETVVIKGDVVLKDYAFANCANLKTVIFEGKNITIGANAFAGCTNLADIQFVSDVELSTGVNAFNDTKWFSQYPTDFIIAGTTLVAYVGKAASATVPLSITKIGNGAFKGNKNLQSVTITQNITSIGDEAFMDCAALKEVAIAEDADFEYVGVDVFKNTSYYDNYEGDFFCIQDRLIKYLGNDMDVMIPNTVKEVAADAFMGCYSTTRDGAVSWQVSSIRIPASVAVCEDNCFTLYTTPTTFVPVLYVYGNTAAASLVAEKGYKHVVLGQPGDVDIDAVVSAADARSALRFSVGLDDPTALELYMADVDGDFAITANDARTILRVSVGLDDISAENLLNKPSTTTEILQYYNKVLDKSARLRAGYTKTVTGDYASNNTAGCSLDTNTYTLYLNPIMKNDPSVVNSSRAYESNTEAAVANLVTGELICEDAVKSASCILSGGKYVITINMNTEEAITDDTFVADIYPVAGRSHFDSMLAEKTWFNLNSNWLTYDLFYKNCTVKMVVDVNTEQIESIDMGVTYYFDNIDGVINLIHVANFGRTTGTGFATRNDTISYSNFVY
ncbi:MAG: leucine-rich repeat protein [Clostridia bacterium]|nr:leucine-rich repeat protein [Clostridia bacterium]